MNIFKYILQEAKVSLASSISTIYLISLLTYFIFYIKCS